MVSEMKIFKHFYENLPFLPLRQPIKFTDLDKSHMKRRELLFFHYKSMGTISCHSNQSSYPTGTKINYSFPRPIDAICEINKRIFFSASEEMSFKKY